MGETKWDVLHLKETSTSVINLLLKRSFYQNNDGNRKEGWKEDFNTSSFAIETKVKIKGRRGLVILN